MQKKYLDRPSPPLPANDYCGNKARGNDGQIYVSVANVKGICRWVLADKVGGVKKGGRISKLFLSPKTSRKISRKPRKTSKKISKTSKKTSRKPHKISKTSRKISKKNTRKPRRVLRFSIQNQS